MDDPQATVVTDTKDDMLKNVEVTTESTGTNNILSDTSNVVLEGEQEFVDKMLFDASLENVEPTLKSINRNVDAQSMKEITMLSDDVASHLSDVPPGIAESKSNVNGIGNVELEGAHIENGDALQGATPVNDKVDLATGDATPERATELLDVSSKSDIANEAAGPVAEVATHEMPSIVSKVAAESAESIDCSSGQSDIPASVTEANQAHDNVNEDISGFVVHPVSIEQAPVIQTKVEPLNPVDLIINLVTSNDVPETAHGIDQEEVVKEQLGDEIVTDVGVSELVKETSDSADLDSVAEDNESSGNTNEENTSSVTKFAEPATLESPPPFENADSTVVLDIAEEHGVKEETVETAPESAQHSDQHEERSITLSSAPSAQKESIPVDIIATQEPSVAAPSSTDTSESESIHQASISSSEKESSAEGNSAASLEARASVESKDGLTSKELDTHIEKEAVIKDGTAFASQQTPPAVDQPLDADVMENNPTETSESHEIFLVTPKIEEPTMVEPVSVTASHEAVINSPFSETVEISHNPSSPTLDRTVAVEGENIVEAEAPADASNAPSVDLERDAKSEAVETTSGEPVVTIESAIDESAQSAAYTMLGGKTAVPKEQLAEMLIGVDSVTDSIPQELMIAEVPVEDAVTEPKTEIASAQQIVNSHAQADLEAESAIVIGVDASSNSAIDNVPITPEMQATEQLRAGRQVDNSVETIRDPLQDNEESNIELAAEGECAKNEVSIDSLPIQGQFNASSSPSIEPTVVSQEVPTTTTVAIKVDLTSDNPEKNGLVSGQKELFKELSAVNEEDSANTDPVAETISTTEKAPMTSNSDIMLPEMNNSADLEQTGNVRQEAFKTAHITSQSEDVNIFSKVDNSIVSGEVGDEKEKDIQQDLLLTEPASSRPWTPSYSVHSQGSVPAQPAPEEDHTDELIVVQSQGIAPNDTKKEEIQEVTPATQMESVTSESEIGEPSSIENVTVSPLAQKPVIILENDAASVDVAIPTFAEPTTMVLNTFATTPTLAPQENLSSLTELSGTDSDFTLSLLATTTPLEVEIGSGAHSPSLSPDEASSSWVPSYSVSRQGSPLVESRTLDEESQRKESESSQSWVRSYSVSRQGSPLPTTRTLDEEVQKKESENESSWVPSYSVSIQGSRPGSPLHKSRALDEDVERREPVEKKGLDTCLGTETVSHEVTYQSGEAAEGDIPQESAVTTDSIIPTLIIGDQSEDADIPNAKQEDALEQDTEIEGHSPKSPWTPSYSVTLQGPGQSADDKFDNLDSPAQPSFTTEEIHLTPVKDSDNAKNIVRPGDSVEEGNLIVTSIKPTHTFADVDVPTPGDCTPKGFTTQSPSDFDSSNQKSFPTIETSDLSQSVASRLSTVNEDSDIDPHLTTSEPESAKSPSSRKRLESTASSRFFPGGWFSSTSKVPDEIRASLEIAQGEFTPSKQTPVDGPNASAIDNSVPPTPTADDDDEPQDRKRWCIVM